jgi:hypothetical protein
VDELARELVWALAGDMAFGDGLRPEPPTDAQVARGYLIEATRSVAVVLRTLAEYRDPTMPPVHSAYWTRADLAALAAAVEQGDDHGTR